MHRDLIVLFPVSACTVPNIPRGIPAQVQRRAKGPGSEPPRDEEVVVAPPGVEQAYG